MGRTRVFSALRRVLGVHVAKTLSPGVLPHGVLARRRVSRRDFALGCAGLAPLALQANTGCSPQEPAHEPTTPERREPRIVVVGAGIAGLHAAYRLTQANLDVTVFEASERVGGRMFTGRGKFAEEQVCELGGELIDSNHRFMFALAKEFNLTLDDRQAGVPADYVVDTWFVGGAAISEQTIVAQFKEVAPRILADLEAADADEAEYERLDTTTLKDYLSAVVPVASFAELHSVLSAAYLGEFGLEIEEQSALNLLYLIDAAAPEPFRIFGDSDERYHIHGGNDQVPQALARQLGRHVVLDRKLVAARQISERYRLAFEDKTGKSYEEWADRVVFALPFTTLRAIELGSLGLSQAKRTIIQELGYGTNTKVMAGFRRRVWREDYHASGAVTSDTPLQQTWDSSIGQAGTSGVLTNFLGGAQGLAAGEGEPEAWMLTQLGYLESVFPGVSAEYVKGSAVRMFWPAAPFALGSYTCYRPGQWAFWGQEGVAEGPLHFCGEHTSAEFQGWMEGGAESGARVAEEILTALQRPLPKALAALVAVTD